MVVNGDECITRAWGEKHHHLSKKQNGNSYSFGQPARSLEAHTTGRDHISLGQGG